MSPLSPLDLLFVSEPQQTILRCLNKQPRLTISQLSKVADIMVDELEDVLKRMVGEAQLVEQLTDGQRTFSVRFGREHNHIRNLPKSVLDIFEQPPDTFLAEVPLTALLNYEKRDEFLAKSTTRVFVPDEVCIWQGQPFEYVGLVRKGLLKKAKLKGQPTLAASTYTHRTEWFGLSEVFGDSTSLDTYIAVTESELLLWPHQEFLQFVKDNPEFGLGICQALSKNLHNCQNSQVRGPGRLWVIESLVKQAGSTTLAVGLSLLASFSHSNIDEENQPRQKVLLWNMDKDDQVMRELLSLKPKTVSIELPGQEILIQHESGVDVLLKTARNDYSPQVQIDILLTHLKKRYDYIICDTGVELDSELILRLRGQADTLLTVTNRPNTATKTQARWNKLQPYTRPDQKRVLVLNQAKKSGTNVDPAFHLVLPQDKTTDALVLNDSLSLQTFASETSLGRALQEVYRRLSLTHSVGIFVPSTIDINMSIDNTTQVHSALSFLGNIFGGATSTEAKGVWQSEESGLVAEQVTMVRAFVSKKSLEQHLDDVIEFAVVLKQEMKQEAIAVDIDNQLILV